MKIDAGRVTADDRMAYLSLEHMAQMPPTVGACDLNPSHSIAAVHVTVHSSWEVVIVCGPAAARVKFVLRAATAHSVMKHEELRLT